jgi:hypothetical protein
MIACHRCGDQYVIAEFEGGQEIRTCGTCGERWPHDPETEPARQARGMELGRQLPGHRIDRRGVHDEVADRAGRMQELQRYGATRIRKVLPSSAEDRARLEGVDEIRRQRQGGGTDAEVDTQEGEAICCPVCGGADISRWSGRPDVDYECLTPGCLHRWLRSDTQQHQQRR